MKAWSCRLKSIPIPDRARKQFLIPAHYNSVEHYHHFYQQHSTASTQERNQTLHKEQSRARYSQAELNRLFPHINFLKPWVVELGTGTGEFLIEVAKHYPEVLFIGIDAAMPCIERAVRSLSLQKHPPANILFYHGLALDFLNADFKGFPLSEVLVNFPDPWPKKRHIKRRLVSPEFVTAAVAALKPSGILITATDVTKLWHYHNEILGSTQHLQKVDIHTLPSYQYYQFLSRLSRYSQKDLAQTHTHYYTAHRVVS